MTTSNTLNQPLHITNFQAGISDKIAFNIITTHGIFEQENREIAKAYKKYKRCLMIIDPVIYQTYQNQIESYFLNHEIQLSAFPVNFTEATDNIDDIESLINRFREFNLKAKEPVLIVGGSLITEVTGFACSMYNTRSSYIAVPTTLRGLIDATIGMKLIQKNISFKNRLGLNYHHCCKVVVDFSFLKTLPQLQLRNGIVELSKIGVSVNPEILAILENYGELLLNTGFGYLNSNEELQKIGHDLVNSAINTILALDISYVEQLTLNRLIPYGHTWSTALELKSNLPLHSAHAISIDMAYGATLALRRGYITSTDRDRLFNLMSTLGLSIDHPLFDLELVSIATELRTLTHEGKQMVAIPESLGSYCYINDLNQKELKLALQEHKNICANYPRQGQGIEAYGRREESLRPVLA